MKPGRAVAALVSGWTTVASSSLALAGAASSAETPAAARMEIRRSAGEIALDGDLGDAGWQGALAVDRWYEIDPAENEEPKVATRALLAYDDRFLYVALELAEPEPAKMRDPLADRDVVLSSNDYAGILVDSRGDGKTAQEFLVNPRGVQYDGLWSDSAGEDLSPDYYWDARAGTMPGGWTIEMRIPFSTLRFDPGEDPVFGIILFRNWPRDFRYQIASVPSPHAADCFVCNAAPLAGFSGLPAGSHYVIAPYATADRTERAEGGPGTDLVEHGIDGNTGVDVKWSPNPSLAVDLTVNPDFSQVESDVAQVGANRRFALFFPEKRPFFLEGVDLFSTPLQAVYTRTVTDPRAGLRATGRFGEASFTALLVQDRGGGLAILPGPTSSGAAQQDFESDVFIGRLRYDLGLGYLSFLATGREIEDGGSSWVAGPDFEWNPSPSDTVKGQLLWSRTETPVRPDLADEWDGRELADTAANLNWSHDTGGREYWILDVRQIGAEFRADNGFIPQVGYRDANLDLGYEWALDGTFDSIIGFVTGEYAEPTEEGPDLLRSRGAGFQLGGKRETTLLLWYVDEEVFAQTRLLSRRRPWFLIEVSPSPAFPRFRLEGFVGEEVDFDNEREGTGGSLTASATLRAGDHLEVKLDGERSWLDVDANGRSNARLFTADLLRLKATYNFTARSFVRAVGQWSEETRDPSLYLFPVEAKFADFGGELLFAYKLNWQSVFFLGYSDLREEVADPVTGRRSLEPAERRLFVKVSYAFQR